jgi:hypothetical protein
MEAMILMLKKEEKKLYVEYKNNFWKYGKKAIRTIAKRREWRVIAKTLVNLGFKLKRS